MKETAKQDVMVVAVLALIPGLIAVVIYYFLPFTKNNLLWLLVILIPYFMGAIVVVYYLSPMYLKALHVEYHRVEWSPHMPPVRDSYWFRARADRPDFDRELAEYNLEHDGEYERPKGLDDPAVIAKYTTRRIDVDDVKQAADEPEKPRYVSSDAKVCPHCGQLNMKTERQCNRCAQKLL